MQKKKQSRWRRRDPHQQQYVPCQFVKKYCFSIKFLHAYLQYVCNVSTKCWKDPIKGLSAADFTKYALSIIIYYVEFSKYG